MRAADMPCQLIGWGEFHRLCRQLAFRIRAAGFQPTLIVAVGRGGYMPARILSDFLGVMNLTSFKIEHYQGPHQARAALVRYGLNADITGHDVLLVDDVTDSGDTFRVALEHVRSCGAPRALRTAVLHHKVEAGAPPDFYGVRLRRWRWLIYPWAVYEDLSHLLGAMEPMPHDVHSAQAQLLERHQVQVPPALLQDVLAMMARS